MDVGTEEIQLHRFIDQFYDAAVDPSLWPPIALQLARLFASESCVLLVDYGREGSKFLSVTDNIRDAAWPDPKDCYCTHRQWLADGLLPPDPAVSEYEIAQMDWSRTSEFQSELAARTEIYSFLGTAMPLSDGRCAIVGVHRPKLATPFGRDDIRRLDLLIPHLRRAIQLSVRLSDAGLDHQAALDGLERSHSATMVVDGNGVIIFATRLAEAILRQADGLQVINGRLACADRLAGARLALLMRTAADAAAGTPATMQCGLAIERGEDRLPLTVLVAPFRPPRGVFGAPLPAALVFVRDPETAGMAADVLKDLFGLTPAQAAVAARLAQGECLEHIAARLRITLHTARDHLKIVFAKTSTSRQPQLVALLTRTVAMIEATEEKTSRMQA